MATPEQNGAAQELADTRFASTAGWRNTGGRIGKIGGPGVASLREYNTLKQNGASAQELANTRYQHTQLAKYEAAGSWQDPARSASGASLREYIP